MSDTITKPKAFTSGEIWRVLKLTSELSADTDIQLSILSRALITACKFCHVPRAVIHREIDRQWDTTPGPKANA